MTMTDQLPGKVESMSIKDYKTYDLGDFKLQGGGSLPGAFIGKAKDLFLCH